jgi:hypothetical protein
MTTPRTRAQARARRRSIRWYLVRRWTYGVAIAAGGILVYYRVIEPEALVVWLPLVLALFNTRPPATPDESEPEQ